MQIDGNPVAGVNRKKNKKSKKTKVKERDITLVLGGRLRFDEIMDTTKRVLEGRFRGKRYTVACLRKWV